MIQSTSRLAYDSIVESLGARQSDVYGAIKRFGEICNLQIAHELRLPINSITPRVKELRELGLVEEAAKRKSATGRTAIYWKVKRERPAQEGLF